MIQRRDILIGGGAAALLPAIFGTSALGISAARAAVPGPVPAGGRLGFDIMHGDSKMGTHVLNFTQTADMLTVRVTVDLTFKLLGMTVYRYAHRCTEVWHGGELFSLDSTTVANGKLVTMTASRGAGGLAVTATDVPRYVAPANALPATHWNMRELDGPWINTQTGKLMRLHVAPGAIETIPAAHGATIKARRYDLTGEAALTIFYASGTWAGLTFTKGGATVRYERQA